MDNLNYEQKLIVRHIEQTYQYNISYLKAWWAKQRVFDLIVTIHMLHYQLKPLILIVYAAYPVGCGCR